jgi:hypothetical protein
MFKSLTTFLLVQQAENAYSLRMVKQTGFRWPLQFLSGLKLDCDEGIGMARLA